MKDPEYNIFSNSCVLATNSLLKIQQKRFYKKVVHFGFLEIFLSSVRLNTYLTLTLVKIFPIFITYYILQNRTNYD
jgi:hypothetical protein